MNPLIYNSGMFLKLPFYHSNYAVAGLLDSDSVFTWQLMDLPRLQVVRGAVAVS